MSTFLLEIITPDHLAYSGEVDGLTVRGIEGELGILPGHIPFITPLQVAPINIKIGKEYTSIAVSGGFVEVRKDKVVVLAESAELETEIDVERAIAAKERAERRIGAKKRHQADIDFERAELALKRAMNRINVYSHLRK
ncbi:F0F1 ATP synthase subunit epsilon [Paenibacillus crassostreae]|uniref:ATP synthase epsilon chain n=1 Tax=Paenibacillus crassostreae TaxID=1763538 RepID=A0A167B389_9BACL|nr:F0F1 ATP synthase subunit epsilon [Paenibacillus crassostreae]AOZ93209.1 F0F1 ATP synthase subunit epsilon [Paenibacillus crassostreae]OAB71700.1 ATP synthase F1 subunit epsilon [Paenibacillus crassostreae]